MAAGACSLSSMASSLSLSSPEYAVGAWRFFTFWPIRCFRKDAASFLVAWLLPRTSLLGASCLAKAFFTCMLDPGVLNAA
eukprot:CAMPEP_0115126150 /NCGR_PEP_ID=MMETSP0227-20121206/49522_1 /TAXON_ID=89957 /ORGANISM="Polarella glacialis, Strain CCMP 1383" /LENGTH=79 /DNA_ID=CAMNT_0002529769 /DNA_START=8 /DNA_END=243 /DNA_ORIENTATION=-